MIQSMGLECHVGSPNRTILVSNLIFTCTLFAFLCAVLHLRIAMSKFHNQQTNK